MLALLECPRGMPTRSAKVKVRLKTTQLETLLNSCPGVGLMGAIVRF